MDLTSLTHFPSSTSGSTACLGGFLLAIQSWTYAAFFSGIGHPYSSSVSSLYPSLGWLLKWEDCALSLIARSSCARCKTALYSASASRNLRVLRIILRTRSSPCASEDVEPTSESSFLRMSLSLWRHALSRFLANSTFDARSLL
jgi:hypothetical protein